MKRNYSKNNIKEKVFEFYAKNKEYCDENYTLAEDDNISKIYDEIINEINKNTLFVKTSIVLLTANKYERNILHKRIYLITSKKIKKIEIELLTASERFNKAYAYWFEWNNYAILHIHANMTGSYTIGGSADVTRWILSNKYLFPRVIISFGVCFGIDKFGNELGDVIIAQKVYPYFIGAKLRDEDLDVVDDNVFGIDPNLYNKIKDLKNNNVFNKLLFKVKFENYITGEAVISSQKERDRYTKITTQKIFAGEMEGYGLFKECTSNNYNVPCMVLKSICDWGIDKNFDENDINVLDEFKTIIIKYTNNNFDNEECKRQLKSLKDRIQAFSANCAFDALKLVIESDIFGKAILDGAREYIYSYKGVVSTCKKIKEAICNIADDFNLGYTLSDGFIHRCLMIFEEEGLIQCESNCLTECSKQDECINQSGDTSIDIRRETNSCILHQ